MSPGEVRMCWLRGETDSPRRAGRRALALGTALALASVLGAPAVLHAQVDDLVAICPQEPPEASRLCRLVVQGIEVGQPRVGLALAGGNPVPGTASTLGLRLGRTPRVSLTARGTLVAVELPPIRSHDAARRIRVAAPAIGVNAAVGVLSGYTLLPTVGGIGSLDLLGSLSLVPIGERQGFEGGTAFSWGVGARLGLLRESFTMPGLSVSAMYRGLDEFAYGDRELQDTDAYFRAAMSNISVRAAASKRILLIGATAGIGYDRYTSDLAFGVREPAFIGSRQRHAEYDGFANTRWNAFVNVSWTILLVHLVGEAGWQSGGERVPGLSDEDIRIDPGAGALYGGIAVRIAI